MLCGCPQVPTYSSVLKMEATLSSGGPTCKCGVFHMKYLLCFSRGRQQMKPEVKYSVARYWKAPFSYRWKHYLSRLAFVDFFKADVKRKWKGDCEKCKFTYVNILLLYSLLFL